MKKYTKEEFNRIKSTFTARLETAQSESLDDMKISIVASSDKRTYNNDITQTYTNQSSDYYEELTNSGMKKYSKLELDKIKSEF